MIDWICVFQVVGIGLVFVLAAVNYYHYYITKSVSSLVMAIGMLLMVWLAGNSIKITTLQKNQEVITKNQEVITNNQKMIMEHLNIIIENHINKETE